jgi:pimeloyl-ACP methyl ester carboxylesterase
MTVWPPVRHVIYLHGFASSPASDKAERFRRELTGRGVGWTCPDLNAPAFETLTTTRMVAQVAAAIEAAEAPVALVGVSLGAFVALHAADRDGTGKVDRLVLLAPAVDFGGGRLTDLAGHPVDEWRAAGRLRIMHHALEQERDIEFGLYDDALQYDAMAVGGDRPSLVFQGLDDDVVSPASVRAWAAARPGVHLRLLADGHRLNASIDTIWHESAAFLGLD